jgi:hypothetical protein
MYPAVPPERLKSLFPVPLSVTITPFVRFNAIVISGALKPVNAGLSTLPPDKVKMMGIFLVGVPGVFVEYSPAISEGGEGGIGPA